MYVRFHRQLLGVRNASLQTHRCDPGAAPQFARTCRKSSFKGNVCLTVLFFLSDRLSSSERVQRADMAVAGGASSSVLASSAKETAALKVNPADVPALEIKLGALAVLLSVTLLFGFAPLCIVRGAGRFSVQPGRLGNIIFIILVVVWMSR